MPGSKIFVQKYSFKRLPTININCSSFVTTALLPSKLHEKFEKMNCSITLYDKFEQNALLPSELHEKFEKMHCAQ